MISSFLPVITSNEMRRIEALAISDGSSEEAFMKEAGKKIALHAEQMTKGKVVLLLGKGNKGGDALVAGTLLLQKGISVRAVSLYDLKDCSSLQQKFREEFIKAGGVIEEVGPVLFSDASCLIDGLLGTGFQGEIVGEMAALIRLANQSGKPIISIDVPSGLDGTTGAVRGDVICATKTVTLGAFKTGLFLNDGWNQAGEVVVEEFGLPPKYLEQAKVDFLFSLKEELQIPSIKRNRHKYEAGYVVGFSGSSVFRGAPKLAGLSSLKSGAGIVRVFHLDQIGETPMSLICEEFSKTSWDKEIKRASAIFVGPGIGEKKQAFLKTELPKIEVPLVCDAEAVQKDFEYPPFTVLTPHRGEAVRLFSLNDANEEDLFACSQAFVEETNCILLLKGAPTWVFSKGKLPIICAGGDPCMAKAGSGDVLSGILAALLAQKMNPLEAAVLGVHLHFLCGEVAAREKGSYSMIAEDLIDSLPRAIREI